VTDTTIHRAALAANEFAATGSASVTAARSCGSNSRLYGLVGLIDAGLIGEAESGDRRLVEAAIGDALTDLALRHEQRNAEPSWGCVGGRYWSLGGRVQARGRGVFSNNVNGLASARGGGFPLLNLNKKNSSAA
jgi:hypothetical protein